MIDSLDPIEKLPFVCAARLNSDEYFCDIAVAAVEEGNVASIINEKEGIVTTKNGKRGACVIVPQIAAEDDYPELVAGPLKLLPAFLIYEQVEMNNDENGTKKPSRKIARRVLQVMKSFSFPGLCTLFVAMKPTIIPIRMSERMIAANVIGHEVDFYCYEHNVDNPPVQCTVPTFTQNGGNVVLTAAQPNYVIYYTTDDTYPAAKQSDGTPNPDAQVYAGPIAIPAQGITICAVAYAQGMIASEVVRAEIT